MPPRRTIDPSIGERIATRRKLLGYSVRHAADRAGLAPSTWSRIERGLASADNRFILAKLAEALKCSVHDLTGQPAEPTDRGSAETSGAVYETIRAVIESDLRCPPMVEPLDLSAMLAELDLVDDLRARCDYSGAAGRLPRLIRSLHASAQGPQRPDTLRALVLATDTASLVVRCGGQPAAAALVAERAQQAAEALEEPVMLGLAAWSRSHAAAGCGLYERGGTIAQQAVTDLQPHLGETNALEMYGALLLQRAFAAFAIGDNSLGDACLAEAEEVAVRTGDSPALKLMFGPTDIRFWRIAIETDGGDPGEAVKIARDTNPLAIPRVSRQASFYADTGRALARLGRDQEAVRMLVTAERLAPQYVRNSPVAAETARALLDRARRNAAGVELRGLCERLGVLA